MVKVAAARAVVPEISADDAMELHGQDGVMFLDVRDDNEVAAMGKIADALHISRGMLDFKADKDAPMYDPALNDAKTLIVYCATGGRSALAGQVLVDLGYPDVRNLGSFSFWLDADGPVDE